MGIELLTQVANIIVSSTSLFTRISSVYKKEPNGLTASRLKSAVALPKSTYKSSEYHEVGCKERCRRQNEERCPGGTIKLIM